MEKETDGSMELSLHLPSELVNVLKAMLGTCDKDRIADFVKDRLKDGIIQDLELAIHDYQMEIGSAKDKINVVNSISI